MLYLIQFGFVILHLGHVDTKLQRFPSNLPGGTRVCMIDIAEELSGLRLQVNDGRGDWL